MSEHYYIRAFSTNLGARSESDLVYTNFCFARLNEEWRKQFDAFAGWIRTSLHWISSNVPEAINLRTVTAILGYKPSIDMNIIDEVSATLSLKLVGSAKACKLHRLTSALNGLDVNASAPVFVRSACLDQASYEKIKFAAFIAWV